MWRRVEQFFEAGRPPTEEDYAFGRERLTPALYALFAAQHPRDVLHSANTARWLLARGHDDPDLVAAGLLHDVGKGHQRRVDRSVYVVACNLRVGSHLAAAESRFELRRAVARSLDHSAAGAALLKAAGAPAAVVALTRRHHLPAAGDPVVALLQEADAAS